MLCFIVILALSTLATCQTDIKTQSLFDQEEKSNIPQDILDKGIGTKDNKLSDNYDLSQQFSSSKERPELNPVLSALINEDVKKSIEAKRQVELDWQPTTFKPILTTTTRPVVSAELVNNGLVDQPFTLDEAGSENKQTSRIQIKKGPNGEDYEYEYVYYYYDDEEKNSANSEKRPSSSTTEKPSRSSVSNKSRYTTVDRSANSGTVPEQNEVVSRGGKQRHSIPVVEEVSEERLPLNTRFPPRNANTSGNVTPAAASDEPTKKISVKRPSTALVDSQTFNRDDKGSKGTRNLENEFSKPTEVKESPKKVTVDESTELNEIVESTTPLMEKVAFDLYAILANENSNVDSEVTTSDDELVTGITEGDATTDDGLTTITVPVTTTTTTVAPTTTTTTTTTTATTTTTTTTTEAPLIGGRKSPFGAGRNRFRLRPQASSTESSEQVKEAPVEQSHPKPNRFSRPTFNTGNRASRTTTAAPAVDEEATKEVVKPVSNAASIRGRPRNRFNLRGSTTTEATDENVVDNTASTTQKSSLRLRPSFQVRTRGRPTASSAATVQSESGTAEQPSTDERPEEKVEEKATPTRPSRFNVGRPNRLLGRSRTPALSTLKTSPANAESDVGPSASGETESTKSDDETNSNDGVTVPESSTPETGLNRLRNRPRIQITASTARTKAPAVAINRKVNPLIARRKLGSSTTQDPTSEEEVDGQSNNAQDDAKEGDDYENSKESKNSTTDVPETSSEPPRGLGLLGNRKRLPIRRPGTLVST